MFPRAVLPPASVVATWSDLDAALDYAAVEPNVWRAVARQLGDPDLVSLQIVSVLPSSVLRQAMDNAHIGARALTPVEKGALSLALNAARTRFGLEPTSFMEDSTPALATAAPPTSAGPPSGHKLRVKMSQVIDQGADQEVEVLPHDEIAKYRQQYMLAEGDAPLEREEVTDAQLSCLKAKVSCEAAPFVDMGVWGPYGERLARQMKFTSQVLKDGQWKSVEIPGASSIEKWEESWRIFRTACIMLNIAAAAVIDRYASEFRQRVAEYPNAWHLAAQADIRCRTEFWPQERRRQKAFHQVHQELSSFNPRQPWNSVIKASACNSDFWAREFEKPALRFQVMGPKDKPAKMLPGLPAAEDDRKRKFDPQRKDGRYLKSRSGINICYDWSRNEDGCNNEQCPHQFAHICEWCRQPHRSINCPQRPGWTSPPPQAKGAGKGGKGAQKGKKRHS